jgi:pyrimidine-specific ribonucleoside hydrolase
MAALRFGEDELSYFLRMKQTLLLFFLSLSLVVPAQVKPGQAPVQLILDTDIGPDYDDVGAMAVMHALADEGRVNILATMASNQVESIASVLNVLNTWYGRPGIPIGVVRGQAVNLRAWQKWDSVLLADYPHAIRSNEQAEDALTLYRKILSQQPDGSVTICTIGFFTNLANLLKSAPDRFSDLSGSELVRRKVKKLVSMAGHFPEGKEFNVDRDPQSSKYVVEHWPTQIFFSGFEIGWEVRTGLALSKDPSTSRSPIKDVFARCIPMAKEDSLGRMSWDETAVLVAISGYEDYYELQDGYFVCNDDGSNSWDLNGEGHYYLVKKEAPETIAGVLNKLMAQKSK